MTTGKGNADFLLLGDWNAVCFECGRKKKASSLRRHWQGYYVCPEHWEPRQPQDFVRGTADTQTPPWTQPMPAPVFIGPGTQVHNLVTNDDDNLVTHNGDNLVTHGV